MDLLVQTVELLMRLEQVLLQGLLSEELPVLRLHG